MPSHSYTHTCKHTMLYIAVNRQLNSLLRQWQIGVLNNGSAQRHECHFSLQSIMALGWMIKGGLWAMAMSSSAYHWEWAPTECFLHTRHLNELRQWPSGMWCEQEKKPAKKHESHIHQLDIRGSCLWKENLKELTKPEGSCRAVTVITFLVIIHQNDDLLF